MNQIEHVVPDASLSEFALPDAQVSTDKLVYTRYVRAITASGEPPDPAAFEAVLQALRYQLRQQIRRRGLWQAPPSYLGIHGWRHWAEPAAAGNPGPSWRSDALAAITLECYTYIFLDRLRSLRAQLEHRPSIEGMISLNIRHFLVERQRLADPLGARLYRTLRAAVRNALERGQLYDQEGDSSVTPQSLLTFDSAAAADSDSAIPTAHLRQAVAEWLPGLSPELVTAMGHAQRQTVSTLAQRLLDLEALGPCFRFADLSRALTQEVRSHWVAVLKTSLGEPEPDETGRASRTLLRLLQPDTSFEDWQSLRTLERCVVSGIEGRRGRRRTLDYLLRLWSFCRAHAADRPQEANGTATAEHTEGIPSARQLALLLKLPRERIPGLFSILRDLVLACRRAVMKPAASAEPN